MPFIKQNAFFTPRQQLFSAPADFVEPCAACHVAARGAACSECFASMHQENNSCVCFYSNYDYLQYYDECFGAPELIKQVLNDTVAGVDFSYFARCTNNYAFQISYSATLASHTYLQFFHDDYCGLSNIWLNGSMKTSSAVEHTSEVAGVVFTKTTSMVNATIDLNMQNTERKLAAYTLFAKNASASISLQNIIIYGGIKEWGNERNLSAEFRINVLFHTLHGVNLTLSNVMLGGTFVKSYWDGNFNTLGVGAAVNCNITAQDIYIGDKLDTETNPTVAYEPKEYGLSDINCSEKMSLQILQDAVFYDSMPAQLLTGRVISRVDSDSSGQGALVGLLENSSLQLYKAVIAVIVNNNYSPKKGALIVVEVSSSSVNVSLAALHFYVNVSLFSGALGYVHGAGSQLQITASLNMTAVKTISGFIGVFENAMAQLSLCLNVTFMAKTTGGVIGQMNSGVISLLGAYGYVKTNGTGSNNEVGVWEGGQFDDQLCDETPCLLDTPESSYVNVENVDGSCGPKEPMFGPIGDASKQYFVECAVNAKFKITWDGNVSAGNVSVFNPSSACQLVNVNVTGSLGLQTGGVLQYGLIIYGNYSISHLYIDMSIEISAQQIKNASLGLAIFAGKAVESVVLKGSASIVTTAIGGWFGGLAGYMNIGCKMNEVSIYGI